jgi:GcrA cell cycle regulator
MAWTDERIDELRKLWADGLTASQIASSLGGISRNAVIGKIHRLGLSGRIKATSQQVRAKKRRVAAERPAYATPSPAPRRSFAVAAGNTALKAVVVEEDAAPLARPEAVPAPAPRPAAVIVPLREPVGLMELKPSHCRWPIGHPGDPDFRFCGLKSPTGQPYCAGHAAKAYASPLARRKKASG